MSDRDSKIAAFLHNHPAAVARLLEFTGDALYIVDEQKNIIFWNAEAESLTGFPREEVIGRHCLSGIRCEDCMRGCGLFESGEIRDMPVTLLTRDGRQLHCRKNAFLLKDANGELVGGVEILRDETELINRINSCSSQRRTIEVREQMQSAILNTIAEGVITIDTDFVITSFSSQASEISGIAPSQALGRHCYDVIGSPLCKNDCPVRHCQISGDEQAERATQIRHKSGSPVEIAEISRPLRSDDPSSEGALLIIEDRRIGTDSPGAKMDTTPFAGMVGHSAVMRRVFAMVEQVAPTDATVLITGESGTGKEMIARAVHRLSKRGGSPFEAINCAALPENLLESELFGHSRGAFTGAVRERIGRIEGASGGTLFLDEIGEMSLSLQAKLLRFLQEREYQRVGENKTRTADVRIIAATNQDLEASVRTGAFREDLLYRIKVIPIHLPPLRDRREDVPLLAAHILLQVAGRIGRAGLSLSPGTINRLTAHHWPGNVRELFNAIEYAATLAPGRRIRIEDLPAEIAGGSHRYSIKSDSVGDERSRLEEVLRSTGGNRSEAARRLGMHRVTLHRKLKKYGM